MMTVTELALMNEYEKTKNTYEFRTLLVYVPPDGGKGYLVQIKPMERNK